jgi:hypothetical protein
VLPAWVPPPGQVGLLTRANGRLANSFISQCVPYFAPYYYAKIVNDYSGSFLNPHFGSHGAILFFGGGHASTNDNTLSALVLGTETSSFRRLIDPSPIFGSDSSNATIAANTVTSSTSFINMAYAEYLVDGKPAAPHSYSSGDVIGPADGGAANGTFLRVLNSAAGFIGTAGAEAAHSVDFEATAGPYRWRRVTNNYGFNGGPGGAVAHLAPPNWTAWVPSQNRVYIESRAAGAATRLVWFDRASSTWITGTGQLRLNDAELGEVTGAMFHVRERNLLVFADCKDGVLRLQYLDTTLSQPSWVSGIRLSQPVPLELAFTSACWCEDNQRILVGELQGDNGAIFEVEIPALLSAPWVATRAPFGAGQTIPWASYASYKKWSYNPRIKAVVYFPRADPQGLNDTVYVYRPRNT